MTRRRATLSLFLLFVVGLAVGARAGHQWSCYEYPNNAIAFYNGAAGTYYNVFQKETFSDGDSWNPATVMTISQVGSYGTSDQTNALSGNYGPTSWLGLATIFPSGCTINYAEAALNAYWLDGYGQSAKEHVACQEVGHTFGLDHQYGSATCMNDSRLDAPQPDGHDADMLLTIYSSARFYENADFGGQSLSTKEPPIDVPSLSAYGWDDRVSSVFVEPGRTVTLYENDNYGGASLTLTSDAPNLDAYPGPGPGGTWSDAASSFTIR